MTKRFLIPLDGSDEATAILGPVEAFAAPNDVFVLLMAKHPEHATRMGVMPGVPVFGAGSEKLGTTPDAPGFVETEEQSIDRQLGEATDYLEHVAIGLRERGFAVEMTVELQDDLGKAIIKCAGETTVDVIAMLSKHHRRILSSLFGEDDTEEVVNSGIAPVLLIPQ